MYQRVICSTTQYYLNESNNIMNHFIRKMFMVSLPQSLHAQIRIEGADYPGRASRRAPACGVDN